MIFTTQLIPYQPQIAYHQQFLNIKEAYTFFCVTLDNKLKFNKHIQIIGKKWQIYCTIYKLKNFVPFNILRHLTYTLLQPYLFHCNIIWSNTNEMYLKPQFILQKRVIRILCKKPFLAHINVLFKECKTFKLSKINKLCVSVYMPINKSNFELI